MGQILLWVGVFEMLAGYPGMTQTMEVHTLHHTTHTLRHKWRRHTTHTSCLLFSLQNPTPRDHEH